MVGENVSLAGSSLVCADSRMIQYCTTRGLALPYKCSRLLYSRSLLLTIVVTLWHTVIDYSIFFGVLSRQVFDKAIIYFLPVFFFFLTLFNWIVD